MAQTLTVKELQTVFGVGGMTIYNWRQGSARKDPLPCEVDDSRRVSFKVAEVRTWAKSNGVEMVLKPADVIASRGEPSKPGPKPKSTQAPPKGKRAKPKH